MMPTPIPRVVPLVSGGDLVEIAGDGSCTHLPQVCMALELRDRRADDLDAEDVAALRWLRRFIEQRTESYDGEAGRAQGLMDRLLWIASRREMRPRRWELLHDVPGERVRRMPAEGGWLYQVELEIQSAPLRFLEPATRHSGWHPPVFVPAGGDR